MLRFTISLTRSEPGHRCFEPASQVHTSRAAGSLATSPVPGETRVHTGVLWGEGSGPDPWAAWSLVWKAARGSRSASLAVGLTLPGRVGVSQGSGFFLHF